MPRAGSRAGSSTTRGSPPCASTMRRKRSSASPPSRACSARATASSWAMPSVASSASRGEQHRQVAQPPAERPAQELDRLDDVERVPDRVAERLRHVRDGDVRGAAPSSRQRQARAREHLGVLGRLHERPRPRLDVEQDQIGVHRELLRHHARGDQRDRRHRRGRVAQGVQLPVGGDEVRGLRGDGAPDVPHLCRDLVGRQVRPQPGDRLELVQRPARVSEPAARELGDRHPERRRDGCERERHAVGHPSGRVLVDRGTTEVAERDRVARVDHRPGQRERLVVVEPAEQARHEERRGERVGDVARGVRPNERLDLVGRQRLPVALARHDDARIVDAHAIPIRSAKLRPSRPSTSTPRSWAIVCPRSPNESRVPISCGPPDSPAASSGVRSRV